MDFESETLVTAPLTQNPYADNESRDSLLVTHSLSADGFDASEDGTGRGTPLVSVAHIDVLPTMRNGADTPAAHNARSGETKDDHIVPVAFVQNTRDEVRLMGGDGQSIGALAAEPGMKQQCYVAVGLDEEQNATEDGMGCLKARREGGGFEGSVMTPSMQVRRLTPRECERLQGVPDGYTLVDRNGKPMADGPRYKMLGNGFAVPVVRWIGERLAKAVK